MSTAEAVVEESQSQPPADMPKKKTQALIQAELAYELLKQGDVTQEDLKAINPRYPGDAIYHIRKELGVNVYTIRGDKTPANPTKYSLNEPPAPAPKASTSKAATSDPDETAAETELEALREEIAGEDLGKGEGDSEYNA